MTETNDVIGFDYDVKVRFRLSRNELRTLYFTGGIHYDAICREAVGPGGFVMGWRNMCALTDWEDDEVTATLRQLDIVNKILEQADQPEDWVIRNKFRVLFSRTAEEWHRVNGHRVGEEGEETVQAEIP